MKSINYYILLVFMVCGQLMGQAPINDNCENASLIAILNDGFAYGNFVSSKADVSNASKERGELCIKELENIGNCSKTVWYKFYIPTTRNISVTLTQQDSAIPQIFAGFNIYKIDNCDYTPIDIYWNFPPLNKFGTSGNLCLAQGWYLIQVGCKKKAKGELWIALKSSPSNTQKNDSLQGVYDFGLINNQTKSYGMFSGCESVEKEEAVSINDNLFNKSLWFSVSFANNSVNNSITIKNIQNQEESAFYKYRIFYNNISPDSAKSVKPFFSLKNLNEILNENCNPSSQNTKIFVQLICSDYSNKHEIMVAHTTFKNDNWNTTNTTHYVTINDTQQNVISQKSFNCNGLLKNHNCKALIPDKITKKNFNNYNNTPNDFDTFYYGAYTILNLEVAGAFVIGTNGYYNGHEKICYQIYKGNINNSCNLIKVLDTSTMFYGKDITICLPKGEYTILTAVKNLITPEFSQILRVIVSTPNIKFNAQFDPEQIRNIDPFSFLPFETTRATFDNTIKSIIIDSITLEGRMTYHEFIVNQDGDFNIRGGESRFYIFEGRLSRGTAKRIKNINYYSPINLIGRNTIPRNFNEGSCFQFKKGEYTIICIDPASSMKSFYPCFYQNHWLIFTPNFSCPIASNIEPETAYPLIKNTDVLKADTNLVGISYRILLPKCVDCRNYGTSKPFISCKNKRYISKTTRYFYYTFFVSENVSLYLENRFELYKGNYLTNPGLVSDSNNIVSPCSDGASICNLGGNQFYTLILIVNADFNHKIFIEFTKHIISENDFASNAFDFGHIENDTILQSTFQPITCHTNFTRFDPKSNYMYLENIYIPYPDTLNLKRKTESNSLTYKNLWFTFTASSFLDLNLEILKKHYLNSSLSVAVFKYNKPFEKNFSLVKNNSFDSTSKSMKLVKDNYYSSTFSNGNCQQSRYFLLLYNNPSASRIHPNSYSIKLKSKKVNLKSEGDNCSNAVTGNYHQYGAYELKAITNCNTFGGSAFEDEPQKDVKSTWYRIKVSALNNFDLATSVSGNIKEYILYGGTCRAMTKITSSRGNNSYFTINCMDSGEYFIQVLSPDHSGLMLEGQKVTVTIKIQAPININCKPYSFKIPIAFFKYVGGCQYQDTIKLQNLSSQGDAMEYKWFLNNQFFSQEKNPFFTRKHPTIKDSNIIKLIAINTDEMTSDTIDFLYILDNNIYKFKINGPALSFCNDSIQLKIETDFPYKIWYNWYNSTRNDAHSLSNLKEYNFSGYLHSTYYFVKGESDNCKFSDSFYLKVLSTLNRYNDTVLCFNTPYKIKNRGGSNDYISIYSKVEGYNVKPGDSISFLPPINLAVYYNDKNCRYVDSIYLKNFANQSKFIDTGICIDQTPFSMNLDAGDAHNYDWWKMNNYIQILPINNYGNYKVYRKDLNNCNDSISFNVFNSCKFTVFIPNAFSPNEDLSNPTFGPQISGQFLKYEMAIYNRYGEKIFNTKNNETWNGTYKSKQIFQDIYTYKITVYDIKNKAYFFSGTITLLK